MTAGTETTGTIYDIGYRRYEGPRLGRSGAVGAVVQAGVRAVFGLGRSGRSKIIPWGAVILAILPAIVAVAVRVLAGEIIPDLYSYNNYLWQIGGLFGIFLAAQAPELVVNDIRFRVLPLYFSRPMSRFDYVAAKLAALSLGLLALTLLPLLILFVGRVLAADDLLGALGDEIGSLPAIVGSAVLHAVVLASVGIAISSLASRRAYAAGAVLAVFLIGGVISEVLREAGGAFDDWAPFLNPLAIIDGARQWLFGGVVAESPVGSSTVPLPVYGLATAVLLLGLVARPRPPLPADHGMSVLRLEAASRWYGNVVAVNDVTFDVGAGITGLLGPNGAGKTTLLHMMAGFLRPSAGTVQLDETPTWRHPEIYRRVGLVPEREAVYGFLTGLQFVTAAAQLQGLDDPGSAAERAIGLVDLEDAAGRAIGGYSKGMRQRVKVAAALVHDPSVLILDEPFNGMDPRQRLHMMDLLRSMSAEGRTILFSSHILEEVERLSDRVLVVVAGRLAASGDFRRIRRLMTDRPHSFTLRSSDDRRARARAPRDARGRRGQPARGHPHGQHPRLRRPDAERRPGRETGGGVAPRAAAGRRVARIGLQLPRAPMTAALVSITLRSLLNRRRTVLLALLGVLLIAVVGLFLLSDPTPEQAAPGHRGPCSATLRSACSFRSSR